MGDLKYSSSAASPRVFVKRYYWTAKRKH